MRSKGQAISWGNCSRWQKAFTPTLHTRSFSPVVSLSHTQSESIVEHAHPESSLNVLELYLLYLI